MRNAIYATALLLLALCGTPAVAQNENVLRETSTQACDCQHQEIEFVTVTLDNTTEVTEVPLELTSPSLPTEISENDAQPVDTGYDVAPETDGNPTVNKGGTDPNNPQPVQSQDFAVDAFPNPTSGMVSFTLPPYTGGSVQMQVYNTAGQQVYAGSGNSTGGPRPTISLDISFLPNGLYTFRMTNGAFSGITRVVLR